MTALPLIVGMVAFGAALWAGVKAQRRMDRLAGRSTTEH